MRLIFTILICLQLPALAGDYKPHIDKAREIDHEVCVEAQKAVSGLSDADLEQITFSSEEKGRLGGDFAYSKPSVSVSDKDIELKVKYNRKMREDTAREIACKMKSQEAIVKATGLKPEKDEATCADINRIIVDMALSLIDDEIDKQYVFLEDDVKKTGISWLNSSLNYDLSGDLVKVTSPALRSGLDGVAKFAGMRYCKLLSVSRVYKHIAFTIFLDNIF